MTMRKKLTTALIALLLGVVPGAIAALRAQVPGGPREGIVVHGHWTIDVREPDGRLVSHREFENALTGNGGRILADILARRSTIGAWEVVLRASATANGPCLIGGTCFLIEPTWYSDFASSNDRFFRNLTVGAEGFVLSGTATAQKAGSIDSVGTNYFSCNSTVLPSVCATYTPGITYIPSDFSQTTLASPQPVVAGQLIQVTVTFTFS